MPSRLLDDCELCLTQAWLAVSNVYRLQNPGKTLTVTATWRSPAEQKILYAQGRTTPGSIVTNVDGVTKLSNHNYSPSRALDFAVLIGGKITWDEKEYLPVGKIATEHGLAWGGNWRHFKDLPHLELPGLS